MTSAHLTELTGDLRAHLRLCEELLAVATDENKALQTADNHQSFAGYQGRKSLLPRLDQSLNALRKWGLARQKNGLAECTRNPEVKHLLDAAQNIIVKILMLDRENQQALLRRGLVPARHLPPVEVQRPNYVANIYQRHAAS